MCENRNIFTSCGIFSLQNSKKKYAEVQSRRGFGRVGESVVRFCSQSEIFQKVRILEAQKNAILQKSAILQVSKEKFLKIQKVGCR